jgi:hypothetical protein
LLFHKILFCLPQILLPLPAVFLQDNWKPMTRKWGGPGSKCEAIPILPRQLPTTSWPLLDCSVLQCKTQIVVQIHPHSKCTGSFALTTWVCSHCHVQLD